MKKDFKSYSQSLQDYFVLSLLTKNKTYIEIGSHAPKKRSNTYSLEVNFNWTGFGVELDKQYKSLWIDCAERKNKIYWEDALTFNYENAAVENNLSKNIGYLSCDIEPPENTYNALVKVINQGFTFDVITFEHDKYRGIADFEIKANNFLLSCGYQIAVYDVYFKNKDRIYETWYINKNIKFDKMSFDQWKNFYYKK